MPKKKRGSGFKHIKTGRYHKKSGGDGSGLGKGRRKYIAGVGYIADQFKNLSDPEENTVQDEGIPVTEGTGPQSSSQATKDIEGRQNKLRLLNASLPPPWKAILSEQGFHAICLSSKPGLAIQREVFAPFNGCMEVFVHCRNITDSLVKGLLKDLQLEVNQDYSADNFCENILKVVNAMQRCQVCAGVHEEKFQEMWRTNSTGSVDENLFGEIHYVKTFRSNSCAMLIPFLKGFCDECKQIEHKFREEFESHQEESVHSSTQ